ncbi:MAG: hypothetical protein ABIE70_06010 [bacterium]
MKKILATSVLVFLLATAVNAGHRHIDGDGFSFDRACRLHNHQVQWDGKSAVVTAVDHDDFEVEINREYELHVDGRVIELNPEQQALVKEYYDQFDGMTKEVKEIIWSGARIGLKGAGVGLKAVTGVVKMIFTDYDEDDLERDIDRAAEKIEAQANDLEKRAEMVEDMAYDLEESFDLMVGAIPELQKLDW